LEKQHAAFAALADSSRNVPPPHGPAEAQDSGLIDLVKRELSDIRFSQTESGRHTQDSLEAVHSTLGHVVDRLAMIEGDLRPPRVPSPELLAPPASPPPAAHPIVPEPEAVAPAIATSPQPKPEMPNP